MCQIGDQLLEVCGINLRGANFESAQKVLVHSQGGIGDTFRMVVQYCPDKYLYSKYNYM